MQKIVINSCYGGFSLSDEALLKYTKIKEIDDSEFWGGEIPRDDPVLIQIVKDLGERAGGTYAELVIIEIPDGVEWVIEEYDGAEWVAEKHKTWR